MNQGEPTAHRARTQSRATERLMEWLQEYAPFERLAILHAGVQEEAEAMRERVRAFLPNGEIPVVQITPVLGSHLGIGALGVACVSAKENKS
jgi:fatty acid-binding protein DegV